MNQNRRQDDEGGDIIEFMLIAGLALAAFITSAVALLIAIPTVIMLTNARRVWYLAAMLPALPLAWLIRDARTSNPDQWVGDTLKAPFRTRTVWNDDPTPTIGEVWANTAYLHGWLLASICAGILAAVAVRLVIDVGLWKPDYTFLQRGTTTGGAGAVKATTPGWEHQTSR